MKKELKLKQEFEMKLKRPVTDDEKRLIEWICQQEQIEKRDKAAL